MVGCVVFCLFFFLEIPFNLPNFDNNGERSGQLLRQNVERIVDYIMASLKLKSGKGTRGLLDQFDAVAGLNYRCQIDFIIGAT